MTSRPQAPATAPGMGARAPAHQDARLPAPSRDDRPADLDDDGNSALGARCLLVAITTSAPTVSFRHFPLDPSRAQRHIINS